MWGIRSVPWYRRLGRGERQLSRGRSQGACSVRPTGRSQLSAAATSRFSSRGAGAAEHSSTVATFAASIGTDRPHESAPDLASRARRVGSPRFADRPRILDMLIRSTGSRRVRPHRHVSPPSCSRKPTRAADYPRMSPMRCPRRERHSFATRAGRQAAAAPRSTVARASPTGSELGPAFLLLPPRRNLIKPDAAAPHGRQESAHKTSMSVRIPHRRAVWRRAVVCAKISRFSAR